MKLVLAKFASTFLKGSCGIFFHVFSSNMSSVVGLTVKGKVARLARNSDSAMKLHVPFESGVNLVIFATLFTDEGTTLCVNGLDVA